MKKGVVILIISTILITVCSHEKSPSIKGTWKWISVMRIEGDTVKWSKTTSLEETGLKMWSDSFYLCIFRFVKDTAFSYSYSGGKYALDGNRYEETVIYHDMIKIEEMIGLKQMMRIEIRNDTLTQTYPVDENGNLIKKYTFIEKYVRLD